MKRNKITYLLLALLAFSAVGCDDDHDLELDRIVPMVIESLPSENQILEELWVDGNKNPLLFTVKWSQPEFIVDGTATPAAPVSYTVEIDKWGVGFKSPAVITTTTSFENDVHVNDLNTVLVKELGAIPYEENKFEIRITAKYGEGEGKTFSSSNSPVLTVTPYPIADLGPLQGVYIIGDMNNWNSSNTNYRIFRANSKEDNRIYTYTGWLNGYFKLMLEEGLGDNKVYYPASDSELAFGEGLNNDNSFYVNGKYVTIDVDLDAMTYTMTDFDISTAKTYTAICFVGDFCAWGAEGADPEMTQTEDPHIWEMKNVAIDNPGYGVKFRDNHSWDNRWCPTANTDIPYGIGRLNPADDPNISITEVGNYYVKFNDLTGHYIVEYKK